MVTEIDMIDQVIEGDVLVTPFTSPEWMPALVRCVALVTEVGGVTSHAAIVSRELDLPCVVGAERATTVLATGDHVTVDGSSGAVRRGS
ncbi:MAG: PEP-utilizing enzyme [Microthrixaceae bacterium]|nr:PEP-utilizing enzyme [Microthrixaceae bacterium]